MRRESYQKGSLRPVGNKWVLRYYEYDLDGKRTRKAEIIGTRKEYPAQAKAEKLAEKKRQEINERLTVAKFTYLCDRYESEGLPRRLDTRASYMSRVRRLREAWGEKRIDWMASPAGISEIERWFRELQTIPTRNVPSQPMKLLSRTQMLSVLQTMFDLAMKWGYLPMVRNPITLVSLRNLPVAVRVQRKKIVLTLEQYAALLNDEQLPLHVKVMIQLSAMTGMRSSEFLGLRWEDVDFAAGKITIRRSSVGKNQDAPKTEKSAASIPMHADLARIMRQWKNSDEIVNGWVFGSAYTGRPFHRSGLLERHLRPAGRRIGVEGLSWHCLRHTYRAIMRKAGVPLEEQRDLMRHSKLPTTVGYGQDDDTRLEELRAQNDKVVAFLRRASA